MRHYPPVKQLAIIAALAIPLMAGAAALTLIHDGPASCDPAAIELRGRMCVVPTDPPGAPSTIVLVAAEVDHHVAGRAAIIAAGLLVGAVLLAFAARIQSTTDDEPQAARLP